MARATRTRQTGERSGQVVRIAGPYSLRAQVASTVVSLVLISRRDRTRSPF
jgi:hypothetical protein